MLNNLDVIFIVIVGISSLVGVVRGMTKECLSIVGWILAAVTLFYLVPVLNPVMLQYVASNILASILSGMFLLIVFSIIWLLTVDKLASLVRGSKLSALDRLFGMVFGFLRGVILVILFALMITTLLPDEAKKGVFSESKFFGTAAEMSEPIKSLIPQSWIDRIRAVKPTKKNVEEKVEDKKDEPQVENTQDDGPSLENTLEFVDSNLQMMQKTGQELFDQLVQPKPAAEEDKTDGNNEDMTEDLDRLLDVLEDKIVTTDENTPEMKSETQLITEKVKKKLSEGNE